MDELSQWMNSVQDSLVDQRASIENSSNDSKKLENELTKLKVVYLYLCNNHYIRPAEYLQSTSGNSDTNVNKCYSVFTRVVLSALLCHARQHVECTTSRLI